MVVATDYQRNGMATEKKEKLEGMASPSLYYQGITLLTVSLSPDQICGHGNMRSALHIAHYDSYLSER